MHIVMHMLVLAEFCIEMFDGGKCQRQHNFSFISGIVAQFLNVKEILVFSLKQEGRISRLYKPKLLHRELVVNLHSACDFKIS